jgi:type II secretory pathway pseudopilin PulG
MIGNAAAVALVIVVLVVGGLIAYAIYQWGRQHAIRNKTRAELTTSEEYRRLSEMAITAQEHTDLKLAEINMQLAQLRDQLDQVQKVLKDVE